MVSTCARIVRVVNIQASEATTSAMTTVVMRSMLPAMMTRMAMAGTVSSASEMTRMTASTMPPNWPAISPSAVPDADADEAGDQAHLQRVGRGVDQQRQHVATLRVGAEEEVRARRLARHDRADLRVRGVDEERSDERRTAR